MARPPNEAPTGARDGMSIARRLVRHAAGILRPIRPTWAQAMQSEIDHIGSRRGALIWAIGCVWAAYVERFWNKTRTAVFAAAFLISLLVAVPIAIAFMLWYTLSLGDLGGLGGGPEQGLARLALGLGIPLLAAAATPGRWQWRTTAGAAFPLLAFGAFLATAWVGLKASQFVMFLAWPQGWIWFCIKEIIAGLALAVSMAAVLSLPFALLYRSQAFIVATLALLPEFATFTWRLSERQPGAHHDAVLAFLGFVWPWLCALVALWTGTGWCNRYLPHWPEQHDAIG